REFYLMAQLITGLVFYPIVCFFGLAGNILSIIVLSGRQMSTSTNSFLIGLAVADTIKLINDVFYFVVTLLIHINPPVGHRALGYMYPYAHYLFNVSVCITAWLSVAVAAERYMLVCHATRARTMCSIARARATVIFVFVSMAVLTTPLALRYRTVLVRQNDTNETSVGVDVTDLWRVRSFVVAYTWTQNCLRSLVPIAILCTLSYFIVRSLRRTSPSTKRRLTSRRRITVMLVSVIVVFVLCVTPDAIISTVYGFGYYEANYVVRGVREITDLLLTVNSAVNFVLYCTFNRIFRKNFIALFC
ncbi:FMRFamide receptor, partial [Lamellibrachia satsuma]